MKEHQHDYFIIGKYAGVAWFPAGQLAAANAECARLNRVAGSGYYSVVTCCDPIVLRNRIDFQQV